jgi:ferric iron reductase protein FhuF
MSGAAGDPSGDAGVGALLTGELAILRGKLAGSDDPRPAVAAERLLEPARLAEAMARYGARLRSTDRRAVASLWTVKYFGTLIPPAVALYLLLGLDSGRRLSAPLADTEILLAGDGAPEAVRLGERPADSAAAGAPMEDLVAHLEAVVAAARAWSGVAARPLWGNAAHYFEWTVSAAARYPGADPEVLAAARRLLETRGPPGAGGSPLAGHIHYLAEEGRRVRRRRVCCLRYRLPEVETCGSLCPVPKVRQAAAAKGSG